MDILVADDDGITRRLLKNMLERFGHSVRTVSDYVFILMLTSKDRRATLRRGRKTDAMERVPPPPIIQLNSTKKN